ncbi:MAG: VOC family protein [Actinomycetales bacterium]
MDTPTFAPSLTYRDPKAAVDWLARAFDFELSMAIEDPGDPTMSHYEMSAQGRGRVMIGAEWADWTRSPIGLDGANTQVTHVHVEGDIDAHCERARAAGATIQYEPQDQFYGDRTYRAVDLEGHVWTFSARVREVTRAEAEAAIGQEIFATDWA